MEREEFLQKIFTLYPLNKGNGTNWLEVYKTVLKENIDYDALYKFTISNYAGVSAPSPAFLLKNAVIKQRYEDKKPVEFETVIAEKNNQVYEYGIEDSYLETKNWLISHGFNNIRLKFQSC